MDASTAAGGAASGIPPEEDLTGVMWNDKVWLSYFPLNSSTALNYFSMSQFYSRSCNNELINMQRLDPALMKTMAGVEYVLEGNPSPGLFIIQKRHRTLTPTPRLDILATYYIIDGNVYQAPSAHTVISNRIVQSLHHLRNAFEKMQSAVQLRPQGGYSWAHLTKTEENKREDRSAASAAEKRCLDRILFDVLEKNRGIAEIRQKQMEEKALAEQRAATGAPQDGSDAPTTLQPNVPSSASGVL